MAKKPEKTTLLVAVDFSPFSEEALFFASELAEKLKAQLLVLHVIHDPAGSTGVLCSETEKEKVPQIHGRSRRRNDGRISSKNASGLSRSGTDKKSHTAFSGRHTGDKDCGSR